MFDSLAHSESTEGAADAPAVTALKTRLHQGELTIAGVRLSGAFAELYELSSDANVYVPRSIRCSTPASPTTQPRSMLPELFVKVNVVPRL